MSAKLRNIEPFRPDANFACGYYFVVEIGCHVLRQQYQLSTRAAQLAQLFLLTAEGGN